LIAVNSAATLRQTSIDELLCQPGGPFSGTRAKMELQTRFNIEYVNARELSDVFVSYARESTNTVDCLLRDLGSRTTMLPDPSPSYKFFRDVESIRSGEMWDAVVTESVLKTKALLVVLSPSYCTSPMCMFELILFLNRTVVAHVFDNGCDGTQSRPASEPPPGITPYRATECEIPGLLHRFNAPLIPAERPLPSSFLDRVSTALSAALQRAHKMRLKGFGGPFADTGLLGPDRDMIGYYNRMTAATRVQELCHSLLAAGGDNLEGQNTIHEVLKQTLRFLT